MKRILLALSIGVGVFTVATATTSSNYGGPKKYDNLAQDTIPKKDTTKKKDTMNANILVMPQQ